MIDLKSKPFNLTDEDIMWVEKIKHTLTIEEKIGQLFNVQCIDMANFSFSEYDAKKTFNYALKYHVGGLHLWGFTPQYTKTIQQDIINDAQSKSKVPVLISGDLEKGGLMGAFDGTNFGTEMQIAATNSEEVAHNYGETIATEGIAMGFNWHFGPVIDINFNFRNIITNTRSFGDTPEIVSKFAVPTIKTIQGYPMAACAKHWPGDGMDDRDQHEVLSINSMSMSEWRGSYKKVYEAAIDAGVLSVMSAHIALPAYYEELGITDVEKKHTPGSLSYELNQKLLREELGFNGLIISDATIMTGMESYCSRKELVPLCIAAGIDMFLFVHDLDFDYKAMLEGYKNGIITEERLDEALTRILALKAALGLHKAKENGTLIKEANQLDIVGGEEHQEWARDCAKKSVTLVKDIQNLLPLDPKKYKKALLIATGAEFAALHSFRGEYFEKLLVKEGIEITRDGTMREENNDYDLVIYLINIEPGFLIQSLYIPPQIDMFKWYPSRVPTMLISLGNPYSLYEKPRIKTVVNAYNSTNVTQEEIVNCLFGRQEFKGVSPVDAFCGLEDAQI